MKKYPAIAIIEFKDIAIGIYATDAIVKKAPISLLKCGIISRGRYLTLICGTTGSVNESLAEGLVHPQVHDAVLGTRSGIQSGAMAIIETPTASSNVRAAEMALKGTSVSLSEMRLADSSLSGKGVSIYRGDLHDIEAAVDIAVTYLKNAGIRVVYKIIPSPSEALSKQIGAGTYFSESQMLDLEGEG
jgi:microcompartment protein CcmL/EutN